MHAAVTTLWQVITCYNIVLGYSLFLLIFEYGKPQLLCLEYENMHI
jgi:hypothetical protein